MPTRDSKPVHPGAFEEGARCLFIGHSFFVPVAKRFDLLAKRNEFTSHRAETVFAPGPLGTPGRLWSSDRHRQLIEEKLATGRIELFGLPGGATNRVEDYRRWIDLAHEYNPRTVVFIGQFWPPGGPRVDATRYDRLVEEAGKRVFEIVKELRTAYPNNRIEYFNFGKTASVMKTRFDAGDLSDVEQLAGRRGKVLFRDPLIGHGGPMMVELSALCWLNALYGAEIGKLEHSPYDESDVEEITTTVLKFNESDASSAIR